MLCPACNSNSSPNSNYWQESGWQQDENGEVLGSHERNSQQPATSQAWGKPLNQPWQNRKAQFSRAQPRTVSYMTTQPAQSPEPGTAGPRLPGLGGRVLRVVLAIAAMLASVSASLLVTLPLAPVLTKSSEGRDDRVSLIAILVTVLASALTTVCALLLSRILVRYLDRGRPQDLALKVDRRALAWLGGMILLAIGLTLLACVFTDLLGIPDASQSPGPVPWGQVIVSQLAAAFLLQGIPEEIIWRGWLFHSLGRGRGAALTSILVFTVLHLVSKGGQQGWVEHLLYLALPLGFATAAMAARWVSGSTWAAVGVHGGLHTSWLFAAIVGAPEQGPTYWITIGALWLIASAAIVLFGRRAMSRDAD